MAIPFDQYQRYKNAQIVIEKLREENKTYRILEVGANEHKNLEKFLPMDEIYYLDINVPENLMTDPHYIRGDATEMTFSDDFFDIVVALDVYEHIVPDRREKFLLELNRVSKEFFIIGAPFNDECVVEAEYRVNELFKSMYGQEYSWLQEHKFNGLPKLIDCEDILKDNDIRFITFSHGNIEIWEKLMNVHFLSEKHYSLKGYCEVIDQFYNEHIFNIDYLENSYRKFVVGSVEGYQLNNVKFGNYKNLMKYKECLYDLLNNFKLLFNNINDEMIKEKLDRLLIVNIEKHIQIFFDYGLGFFEDNSIKLTYSGNSFKFKIDLPQNVKKIRIDPLENELCLVTNLSVSSDAETYIPSVNYGDKVLDWYIFYTRDPQFIIENITQTKEPLYISGTIVSYESLETKLVFEEMQQLVINYEEKIHSLKQEKEVIISCYNDDKEKFEREVEEICHDYDKKLKSFYDIYEKEHINAVEENKTLSIENNKLKETLAVYKEHYHAAIYQRDELQNKLNQFMGIYYTVVNSTSWKITEPARKILDKLKLILNSNRHSSLFYKGLVYIKNEGIKKTYKKVKEVYSPKNKKYYINNNQMKSLLEQQRKEVFEHMPLISILVPLYNTPEDFFVDMVQSVVAQSYSNWQLCLADGSEEEYQILQKLIKRYFKDEKRIVYKRLKKNKGISENTNECVGLAKGEYLALLDHDDILAPNALYEIVKVINEQKADFIYTDEATFEGVVDNIQIMHFKSDFGPDTFRSYNYICHLTVFKADLFSKVGGFRLECDGSQDYDMFLRLTEKAECIVHIPQLLYFWRVHENSVTAGIDVKPYTVQAAKKAISDQLKRLNLSGEVLDARVISNYRIKYDIVGSPLISIIIPNKDHIDDLKKCINSIIEKSIYFNFEILIVENNSVNPTTFEYYQFLEKHNQRIRVLFWDDEFNYAAINNWGAKNANGEYYIFLNNDIEVISEYWMQELLMFAQRKDVGAVGAKLYYPDDTIQHAGIILGIGDLAGHAHKHFNRNDYGYMSKLCIVQNVTAVTGACFMIRKEVFEEINGFDPVFKVALNDVDICLRIRCANYLIVWTPYAELYHYESKSRGYEDTPEKKARFDGECKIFRNRWRTELDKGDPYYNSNLTLDREDYSLR